MKHNDQASFIITFVNYNEPMEKVMKFKVPYSNLKVINNKNEQEPVDIICESEGKCSLFVLVKLDAWSETSIKLISS